MRPIKLLVVHCSDSPDDRDIGAREIREWHTLPPPKGRGFTDIGYHYVVRRSGVIEEGRPIAAVGAHVRGFNRLSIGICLVGRKDFDKRQLRALVSLLRSLLETFKLDAEDVVGHYELDSNKTCPNLPMGALRSEL